MNDPRPLVTVIVPCFNSETYLREALDSILAQTYPHLEVICMDDASTDATPTILSEYGDRITHVRQERNKGIYDNVDDGIALAHGELITTYHADDVYLPTIVEEQVAFMERHPEAGAVFCSDILVDGDNVEYARLTLPPELAGGEPLPFETILNSILRRKNRYLVCPTAMVRAGVYREIDGYRQDMFRNSSDLDCWLRIARRHPIGILEEHLIRYRHSEQQSSRRYHKLRTQTENYFLIMDHHLEAGAAEVAHPSALAAYEAHRAEDQLLIAANQYILGDRAAFREALGRVRPSALLGSPAIQRGRLLVLYLVLRMVAPLPRIGGLAELFRRHWHEDKLAKSRLGFFGKLARTFRSGT